MFHASGMWLQSPFLYSNVYPLDTLPRLGMYWDIDYTNKKAQNLADVVAWDVTFTDGAATNVQFNRIPPDDSIYWSKYIKENWYLLRVLGVEEGKGNNLDVGAQEPCWREVYKEFCRRNMERQKRLEATVI